MKKRIVILIICLMSPGFVMAQTYRTEKIKALDGDGLWLQNDGGTKGAHISDVGNFATSLGPIDVTHPDFGADPTGSADSTDEIQAAIDAAIALSYKPAVYIPKGVYKLSAVLTVQQTAANAADGFTMIGDGYHSVLYQTATDANVLDLKRYKGGEASTWLQGVTIKDVTLIGDADSGDGLYLEGVLRSHFSNIVICVNGKCLSIKGGILNSFDGIRASPNLIDEAPISGVTEGSPNYGIYAVKIDSDPDTMEVTASNFNEIVCEGMSVDGIYLAGGYDNWFQGCVENCTGVGLNTSQWHCWFFLYMEGMTGNSVDMDTAFYNYVNVSAIDGDLVLAESGDNIFERCEFDVGTIPVSNYDNVFISCKFVTTFTDESYQDSSVRISHRVGVADTENYFGRSLEVNGTVDMDTLSIGGTPVTATAVELNYVDGVTSAIQTQLDGKQATITGAATTITDDDLTIDRAVVSNGSGKIAVSVVTSTELAYIDGVTSAIQTQLNAINTELTSIVQVGDANTNGSWKLLIDGADFKIQKRIDGVYVTMGTWSE